MKWPRGRYNGRRIVGFSLAFEVSVDMWKWLPQARWNYGEPMARWLCLKLRAKPAYHYADYYPDRQ